MATLLLAAAISAAAHDIPASVVVQAYVRPQGDHLRVIVRAPLAAMRDVVFPLQGDGLLDLARAETPLRHAAVTWIAHDLAFYEGNARLGPPTLVAVRTSLPSDRSFQTYDAAFAHVTGAPLASGTTLYWNQALLDILLDYPIRSERAAFSVEPTLGRLGVHVVTVLRYEPSAGVERDFEYSGDPGLVRLDPRWHQAALQFVRLGFAHILSGTDHLLFLFCLVMPFRRIRPLVLIVTAFTVAHSMTLMLSAMNLAPAALWFPPLIETLIAASIVYMALENIFGVTDVTRRWMITFAFGLVHGFGFSFALRETLQFAGSHLLTSLLSFNAGVEFGQLLVLAVLVPALALFFRSGVPERTGTVVLSAIVAHTAWHWMIDRWDRLRQFRAPTVDMFMLLTIVRWAFAAVFVAAVIWLIWPRLKSAYTAYSAAH